MTILPPRRQFHTFVYGQHGFQDAFERVARLTWEAKQATRVQVVLVGPFDNRLWSSLFGKPTCAFKPLKFVTGQKLQRASFSQMPFLQLNCRSHAK